MSIINITNYTLVPKVNKDVHYLYANLIFTVDDEATHFKNYLEYSQKPHIERRVYKSLDDIKSFENISFEDLQRGTFNSRAFSVWDFNESHGWFIHLHKFRCWRFHEFFQDNLATRALLHMVRDIAYDVPSFGRSAPESELISCFESLKQWWD